MSEGLLGAVDRAYFYPEVAMFSLMFASFAVFLFAQEFSPRGVGAAFGMWVVIYALWVPMSGRRHWRQA